MKSFILASSNAHKAEEFSELFKNTMTIQPASRSIEIDETGKTFYENAYLKAKAYFDEFKTPAMADDSGLVIEALPNILGVASARFATELSNYKDKCELILKKLEGSSRNAYFVCVLCFYISIDEVYYFEGRVHGQIGHKLSGDHGFGYDPIFIPERKENDGKTLAELPEWKNQFSHRARASQSALQFFKETVDKARI